MKTLFVAAAAAVIVLSGISTQVNAGHHRHHHRHFVLGEPGARWGDNCWVSQPGWVNNSMYWGYWRECP